MYIGLFIIGALVFAFGLISKRAGRSFLTGPMLFVLAGMLTGSFGLDILGITIEDRGVALLAEFTLALVLFTDASLARLKVLYKFLPIPNHLLLVGLPLTIIMGGIIGRLVFPGLPLLEVFVLSIILAPTDAALGKAVIANTAVPVKVRESLNVESGLNDGICVPLLLFAITLTEGQEAVPGAEGVVLFLKSVGIGVVTGLALAWVGARSISWSEKRGWINEYWDRVIVLALSITIFCLAQALGGSGFIACFTGGLLFGVVQKKHKKKFILAVEGISDLMASVTWLFFGAVVGWRIFESIDWRHVVYALLSLTVIRMLPAFISLFRTPLSHSEKFVVAWFGPRGMASLVFIYIVMEEHLPHGEVVIRTAVLTILLSVVLHGISSKLIADYFAR